MAGLVLREPAQRSATMPVGRRLLSIFSGSAGNLVEWYDWYVYSSFAIYFAGAFFPRGDRTAQLLNTAGVFALGFLMRPIGGWLFGWRADRHGRRRAVMGSVFLVLRQRVLLTERQLHEGGWRIPFVIGALCAVVAAALRRGMSESEAFTAVDASRRDSSLRRLLAHPREVLTVLGLTMGGTLSFYTRRSTPS